MDMSLDGAPPAVDDEVAVAQPAVAARASASDNLSIDGALGM
jgi:hypothetical protein